MGKLFKHLSGQFREYYKNLTPVKRASVLGVSVVVFVTLVVLGMMVTGNTYVPLFTNVATEQLPQVAEQLQKRGIPFKISDDGHTILIAKELLHSTQMAIMTEMGGAKVGHVGLEIFAKRPKPRPNKRSKA